MSFCGNVMVEAMLSVWGR